MVRVERKQSKDVEGGIVESSQSWGVLSRIEDTVVYMYKHVLL